MTTRPIGHNPQTLRADASSGRMGNRRVQPFVSEHSSWITMTALGFLALIGGAAAQFTGTYYPKAPVNIGVGSEPLLIPGGEVPQLLFGNGGSLHVGKLDQVGDLEDSSLKEIDSRTPYHSKHVAIYPNGNYGLGLEVPRGSVYDVVACRWNHAWVSIGCANAYRETAAGLHNVDFAGGTDFSLIVFQKIVPTNVFYSILEHTDFDDDRDVIQVLLPTAGSDRNPSILCLNNKFKLALEGDHTISPSPQWACKTKEYSSVGNALGQMTTVSGEVLDNSTLDGAPPNLQLSNLGAFGYAESWESGPPSPTGHYVHFVANDGTNLGTYNLNTSGNIRTGVFTEINPAMVAGAWAWDAASDNKVILELFQRSGGSVAPVAGSSFTIFEDLTNKYTSVSVTAIPNEAGVVVAAEKAGLIWTRVIYFRPLTSAPTPLPAGNPTSPPTTPAPATPSPTTPLNPLFTAFPTITPTSQPTPAPTPLPTSSMTSNPKVLNETLSSPIDETSLTSGDLLPTSAPPETVKSSPKTKTEESSLAWISGIVIPLILSIAGGFSYAFREKIKSRYFSHPIKRVRRRASTERVNRSLSSSRVMRTPSHHHLYSPAGDQSSSVYPLTPVHKDSFQEGRASPSHIYNEAPQGGRNKASHPVPHNGQSIYDNTGAPPGIPTGRSYNVAYAREGVYEDVRVSPAPKLSFYDEAPKGSKVGVPQGQRKSNYEAADSGLKV